MDQLAARIGAAPDLVSRAGLALSEVLWSAAEQEGHTYLPWEQLQRLAQRTLADVGEHYGGRAEGLRGRLLSWQDWKGGWRAGFVLPLELWPWHGTPLNALAPAACGAGNPWPHPEDLQVVAQHMHSIRSGLVAEPGPGSLAAAAAAAGAAAAPAAGPAAEPLQPQRQSQRFHPELRGDPELKAYLRERMKGEALGNMAYFAGRETPIHAPPSTA